MIDLTRLPAAEAERLAYAEGFTGTAELFARIAEFVAERNELRNALENLVWACSGVDYMEEWYAEELAAARTALRGSA